MGRHSKTIITNEGIDRRQVGYYSTPPLVARYLSAELMALNPNGMTVLDPCVGKEELVAGFLDQGLTVDAFDTTRYLESYRCNFNQADFLEFYREHVSAGRGNLHYDFYIANPPYNCHENDYIRQNKPWLEPLFKDVGVLNMYSMFMAAMIELAKPGALIGFLVFDSFLNGVLHGPLRSKILSSCALKQIILCPTDLFWGQQADVRTCIAIFEKGITGEDLKVSTANRCASLNEFESILSERRFTEESMESLILQGSTDSKEIIVGCDDEVRRLFEGPRVKDKFRCVTGISTGNDRRYLSKERTSEYCHPFYKNPGSRRFYAEPNAYLIADFETIGENVPNFIVRNRDILFKPGIVCSSMGIPFSACYMPEGSTFGVNPTVISDNPDDTWWLMAYLNSSLVTYLVRAVLIRTNMITSGYVKRIPLPEFSVETREALCRLAQSAYQASREQRSALLVSTMSTIDEVIFRALNLSEQTTATIIRFCSNVLRYT